MPEDLFLKQYERLNERQKKAVDTTEGPVMVIAGPGTGKTTVLTLRIANILRKTDTPPDGVLALTFTESAVASMRRKLVPLIGPAAYRVGIFTFHGFAEEVIRRYPESFPRILGGDVATESEKLSIVEEILDERKFEYIKPFGSPYHYVRAILHTISDLKRDAVSPEDFLQVLEKEEKDILGKDDVYHEKGKYKGEMKTLYKTALKNVNKNKELRTAYVEYERLLKERKLYDFDDMLLELIRAFEREPDLLQALQEEFLYFHADEHQDANNAQNKILELLASHFEEANLFIVGDEKQAIYRFQGASLENFLYFKNKYPNAKLIYLDENYRSHQNILDTSHALAEILPGDKELRPRLLSKSEGDNTGKINVISFKTERDEEEGIADEVEEEIGRGIEPNEIAILVRTNKEIPIIGRALLSRGIPTNLFQDDDVLNDPDIKKLLLLLQTLVDPSNETRVGETLFIDFLKINPIDAIKIINLSRTNKVSILETLQNSLEDLLLADNEDVLNFRNNFTKWITASRNKNALEAFTEIVSESEYTKHLLALPDSIQKMSLLSALYQEIASRQAHNRDLVLAEFLLDLETLKEHGSRLSFATRLPKEKSVSVMTAHKSKGLEWQTVIIPHVVDGVWGNKRTIADFRLPYPLGSAHQSGKEEDERRLFYVALTRAKSHIVLTHSHLRTDGKEQVVSRFVEEMPKEFITAAEGVTISEEEVLIHNLAKQANRERTIWDKDYLRETFFDQGLNATALNNYLTCPWEYFFKNLIRIPSVPEKHQLYGTAIHSALGFMTNAYRENRKIDFEDLKGAYLRCLDRQPLSNTDYEEAKAKGIKILEVFWKTLKDGWHRNSFSEFGIAGVFVYLPTGERITLRGRLDKLEILGDREVRVVDFKTGRPKTRNELIGATANSNGNEKRQLDFYRLLLELYEDGKYEMTHGSILFTETDDKGRIHEEEFEMSHSDREKVEAEVIRVSDEIARFTFWDTKCHTRDCEFCSLRDMLVS